MAWLKQNIVALLVLLFSVLVSVTTYYTSNVVFGQEILSRLETVETTVQVHQERLDNGQQTIRRFELLERDFFYEKEATKVLQKNLQTQGEKTDALQASIMEMRGDMKVTNQILVDLTEAVKDLRSTITTDRER